MNNNDFINNYAVVYYYIKQYSSINSLLNSFIKKNKNYLINIKDCLFF